MQLPTTTHALSGVTIVGPSSNSKEGHLTATLKSSCESYKIGNITTIKVRGTWNQEWTGAFENDPFTANWQWHIAHRSFCPNFGEGSGVPTKIGGVPKHVPWNPYPISNQMEGAAVLPQKWVGRLSPKWLKSKPNFRPRRLKTHTPWDRTLIVWAIQGSSPSEFLRFAYPRVKKKGALLGDTVYWINK